MLTRLLPLIIGAGARVGADITDGDLTGPGGMALPWRVGVPDGVDAALIGDIGREVTDGAGVGAELPVPGREFVILELVDTVDPEPVVINPGLEA